MLAKKTAASPLGIFASPMFFPVSLSRKQGAILFTLVCAAFVLAKLPHLDYPFYWDESWSYAPGLQAMYEQGPSLLPGSMDTFYSRGHPLFFYASTAAWMSVFGPSHVSMHAFALTVSAACLLAVYVAGASLGNRWIGLTGACLVGTQIVFFVQSTMVLPEVMVALFSLLSLHAWAARKNGWLALWLSLLLLTKESSAPAALVLGLASAWEVLRTRFRSRDAWQRLGAVSIAGAVIAAFFLLQKQAYGWYFFPDHSGYIHFGWNDFFGKFRGCLRMLLFEDERSKLFTALLVAVLVYAAIKRQWAPLLLILPAAGCYLVEQAEGWKNTNVLFIIWGVISVVAIAVVGWYYRNRLPLYGLRFVTIAAIWWMAYVTFSSLNFLTGRYLISALVVTMLIAGWMLYTAVRSCAGRAAPLIVAAIIATVAVVAYRADTGLGDVDHGAYDAMRVQEGAIRYLEKHGHYDERIAAASYQNFVHLQIPQTGFLAGKRTFSSVTNGADSTTSLIIFDNIEPDGGYDSITRSGKWVRVYRQTRGEAWIEIWARARGTVTGNHP